MANKYFVSKMWSYEAYFHVIEQVNNKFCRNCLYPEQYAKQHITPHKFVTPYHQQY
jgi:hypothetical protein